VSTAEQVDGTSSDTQRGVCERYGAARGWAIHEVFVDEGASGAARDRPALDELRRWIRDQATDVVVVAKLDRLGRTVRGLVEWMSEWDDQGVVLPHPHRPKTIADLRQHHTLTRYPGNSR